MFCTLYGVWGGGGGGGGGGGVILIEKFSNFHFIFFHLIFWIYLTIPPFQERVGVSLVDTIGGGGRLLIRSIFLFCLCYYCSINVKRQSKLSGLCPDTSNLVVPTFDKKVTEYLCSGCVFFLQTNFDFLTSHF